MRARVLRRLASFEPRPVSFDGSRVIALVFLVVPNHKIGGHIAGMDGEHGAYVFDRLFGFALLVQQGRQFPVRHVIVVR